LSANQINFAVNHPSTPRPHKPGNYQPEQPSYYQWTYFGVPLKPEQNYHRPGVQQPQVGINSLSDPDWKDPAFFQWFFQPKPKELEPFDGEFCCCCEVPSTIPQQFLHRE